jgi:hypothetical protein
MPKRFAITVAGAVSLGSYEAGVLYEIIEAFRQHNAQAATEDDKIIVDVLTGASAGGMTSTIVAQKLLFEAASLRGAYTNSLYRPWVVDVSLEGLLKLQPSEDPMHSILSSNLIEDISRRYLTRRYESHVPPVVQTHPVCGTKVQLGLALSNLNGVDYCYDVRPSGKFVYTRHQDELKYSFDPGKPEFDSADVWEPIRKAAVSTGAFPFAFRVKDLVRAQKEYSPEDHPDEHLVPFASPMESFSYTDGGTFQNEPLGLAKDLVDELDHHLDTENRFFLFVAPGARGSTKVTEFNETIANLKATAQRLFVSIFEQARFHDWIMAENVNAQIALFDKRATELKNCLLRKPGSNGYVDFHALAPAAQALTAVLFPTTALETPDTPLNKARARLKSQFRAEYDELTNKLGSAAADVWIDAIASFEAAAGLNTRDQMTIYGVTAAPSELASSGISAFAGFFDQRLRDHDYDVGRTKAREFLNNPRLTEPGQIGKINYTQQEQIRPIDTGLDGITLEHMPRDIRQRFKDRLTDRAHEILAELGVPTPVLREGIDLAIVSPFLNRLLYL